MSGAAIARGVRGPREVHNDVPVSHVVAVCEQVVLLVCGVPSSAVTDLQVVEQGEQVLGGHQLHGDAHRREHLLLEASAVWTDTKGLTRTFACIQTHVGPHVMSLRFCSAVRTAVTVETLRA